jgi:hypothetical protein
MRNAKEFEGHDEGLWKFRSSDAASLQLGTCGPDENEIRVVEGAVNT